MMAGADEPATLSGFRQAMAIAMMEGGDRPDSARRWLTLWWRKRSWDGFVYDQPNLLRRYRHPYWQTGRLAQMVLSAVVVSNIP